MSDQRQERDDLISLGIAIGKGLRDAELGYMMPFEDVKRGLEMASENDVLRAELARVTKERDEAVNRRNIAIQEFKDSQRELAALKAERAEDTELLDWLEEWLTEGPTRLQIKLARMETTGDFICSTVLSPKITDRRNSFAKTLRSAIDAARAAGKEGE